MSLKSILLIEDDELDVESFKRVLGKLDFDVELKVAFNGEDALEKINNHNIPDLILLDLNMPRMNGIEFLQHLRKKPQYNNVKIYVITTSNEEEDRRKTEALGVSGYIIKPLNFEDNTKKYSSMDYFLHFQLRKILEV